MRSLFSNRYDNKRNDFYDRYEAARALHPTLPLYERPKEPENLQVVDRSSHRRYKSYQELNKQSAEKYNSEDWLASDQLSIVVRRNLEMRNSDPLMPRYDPTKANHEFSHNARFRQRGRRPNAATMAKTVSDFAEQVGGLPRVEEEEIITIEDDDEDNVNLELGNFEVVTPTVDINAQEQFELMEEGDIEPMKPNNNYKLVDIKKLELPKIKYPEEEEKKTVEQVKHNNTYNKPIDMKKLQLPKIQTKPDKPKTEFIPVVKKNMPFSTNGKEKTVEQVKPNHTSYKPIDMKKLQLPKVKAMPNNLKRDLVQENKENKPISTKQEKVNETVEKVKPNKTLKLVDINKLLVPKVRAMPDKPKTEFIPVVKKNMPFLIKQEKVNQAVEQVKPKNTLRELVDMKKLQLPKIKAMPESLKPKFVAVDKVTNPISIKGQVQVQKTVEQVKSNNTFTVIDINKLLRPKIKPMPNILKRNLPISIKQEPVDKQLLLPKIKPMPNILKRKVVPEEKKEYNLISIKQEPMEQVKETAEQMKPNSTLKLIEMKKLQLPKIKPMPNILKRNVVPGEKQNMLPMSIKQEPVGETVKQVRFNNTLKIIDINKQLLPPKIKPMPNILKRKVVPEEKEYNLISIKQEPKDQIDEEPGCSNINFQLINMTKKTGMTNNLKRELVPEDKENMPAEKKFKFKLPPRIFICPDANCLEEFALRRCLTKHQKDTGHHSWSHQCIRCGQIFRTAGFKRMHAIGACDRNLQKNFKNGIMPEDIHLI